ncbi:unnamed protein product [Closterium sp. Yama58-4]|nr:unnamed protein product [Closterium sp. Yama58-4]
MRRSPRRCWRGRPRWWYPEVDVADQKLSSARSGLGVCTVQVTRHCTPIICEHLRSGCDAGLQEQRWHAVDLRCCHAVDLQRWQAATLHCWSAVDQVVLAHGQPLRLQSSCLHASSDAGSCAVVTMVGAVGDTGVVDTLEARLESAKRRHEAKEFGDIPWAVVDAGIRSVWATEHPSRPASPRPVNDEGGVDVGVNAGGDQVGSSAGGTASM